MRILITGAAGFIGSQLMSSLLDADTLIGRDGEPQEITRIVAVDVVESRRECARDARVESVVGDASNLTLLASLMRQPIDAIFALGATRTSDAETHFAHGYDVNLQGMLRLLSP